MTSKPAGLSPATPATGAFAGWTSHHTAWLLFGPPAFMVAVRWLLQLADDRLSTTPALSLAPVSTTSGTLDLLWPVALGLVVLVALGLLMHRLGWRRVMPVLGAVWVLLWLAGSGAMLQRHLNRQGLFLQDMAAAAAAPAEPIRAQVITSTFKPASLRSLGGTELVLQVAGRQVPQRLLIDDARAGALKPGDTLALRIARGRYSDFFVTGWQPLAPATSH